MKKILFVRALPLVSMFILGTAPLVSYANGPYLGISYGQYKLEFENDDIDTEFEDDQNFLKGTAGFAFNDTVGVEFAYMDFSDAFDNNLNSDIKAVSLAGVLTAPISDKFALFGKAGLFSWEAEITGEARVGPTLITVSDEMKGDDPFYGVGMNLDLSEHTSLNVEYNRYEIDDEVDPSLDTASAGLQFTF